MKINITLGDMAESLDKLRKENGLFYNPSEREILDEAMRLKYGVPEE